MKSSSWWRLLCSLIVLLSLVASGQAQQAGDVVIPREATTLRIEQRDVAPVTQFDRLTIEQVSEDGNWLWVQTSKGERGWVRRGLVLPVTGAETTPSTDAKVNRAAGADATRTLYLVGWLGAAHLMLVHDHLGAVAELQELNPDGVAANRHRVKALQSQLEQLRQEVDRQLATDDSRSLVAISRQQLAQLLAAVSHEAEMLRALIDFPGSESRAAFNESRRVTQQTIQSLTQPMEADTQP